MPNTPARFRVTDIQRILAASRNARVPVRVEIIGDKIVVETVEEAPKEVEQEEPIVL